MVIDLNTVICPGCGTIEPETREHGSCVVCDFDSLEGKLLTLNEILEYDYDFDNVALGSFLKSVFSLQRKQGKLKIDYTGGKVSLHE